jgi:hypothetical protein
MSDKARGLIYAIVGGVIGLAAGTGFPFLLEGNQAPLLVFVTAPLGVLIGTVLGAKLFRRGKTS